MPPTPPRAPVPPTGSRRTRGGMVTADQVIASRVFNPPGATWLSRLEQQRLRKAQQALANPKAAWATKEAADRDASREEARAFSQEWSRAQAFRELRRAEEMAQAAAAEARARPRPRDIGVVTLVASATLVDRLEAFAARAVLPQPGSRGFALADSGPRATTGAPDPRVHPAPEDEGWLPRLGSTVSDLISGILFDNGLPEVGIHKHGSNPNMHRFVAAPSPGLDEDQEALFLTLLVVMTRCMTHATVRVVAAPAGPHDHGWCIDLFWRQKMQVSDAEHLHRLLDRVLTAVRKARVLFRGGVLRPLALREDRELYRCVGTLNELHRTSGNTVLRDVAWALARARKGSTWLGGADEGLDEFIRALDTGEKEIAVLMAALDDRIAREGAAAPED